MTLEEKFWSRVDIPLNHDGRPDRNKCWMWKAWVDKDGYGRTSIGGKTIRSNRFAYELEHGKFDKNKCVLHRCDIAGCCNPEHLWLGTQKDNRQDCKNKERTARGDNNGARTHPEKRARGDRHWSKTNPEKLPRGENNHFSRLTWKEVREIRASLEKTKDLAIKYGVDSSNIRYILTNKTWKNV